MKKNRLTFSDHLHLGDKIRLLSVDLSSILHQCSGKVPVSISGHFYKMQSQIINAKCKLENIMFKECEKDVSAYESGWKRKAIKVYYGEEFNLKKTEELI